MVRSCRPGQLLVGATVLSMVSFIPVGVAHAAPGGNSAGPATKSCDPLVEFDRERFGNATTIDNTFLPMTPGTRLTYEGRVAGSGPHQIVFTVTNLVKEVDGVTNRVIYDVDRSDGEVTEAELAFFSQDDEGNVWNLGEYPEEYDAGKFSGAPNVWISGLEKATGGIHMRAHPEDHVNGKEYLQGRAPEIDFLDCARIADKNGTADVPAGTFTDVLTTYERSPLESTTAIQTKEHAPGVGIVRIDVLNDPEAEVVDLVSIEHLHGKDLREIDDAALDLDKHGHEVSAVYRETPGLQRDRHGHADG